MKQVNIKEETMENKGTAAGGGIGMCGILFVVFLILKLCNVIQWSWWWVTAPLWIPVGIGIICLILGLIFIGIGNLPSKRRKL